MSRDQHRAEAGDLALAVHVLVVSSTRTASTDESGLVLSELFAAAGHPVVDRVVVDDDVDAIRTAVRALADAGASVVVLTGGTGVTGRDVTPEALAPLLQPRLDGFGELFRSLSYAEIGPAAMLSRAIAGLCGRTVVFAVPGSKAACRLAAEKLILPEIGHLVALARKERGPASVNHADDSGDAVDVAFEPAPEMPQPDTSQPVQRVGGVTLAAAPDASPPGSETEAGWQVLIRSWGGSVVIEAREPVPESLERVAPVMDVLQRAGRAAVLVTGDGRRFSLWGFPDLLRASSKVLAVRAGGELGEVLALHRWPLECGTVVPGGVLAAHGLDPAATAERVTGRKPPSSLGPLFAMTAGATLHLVGGRIVRWDGHRERDEGNPRQALASLVLEWSVR